MIFKKLQIPEFRQEIPAKRNSRKSVEKSTRKIEIEKIEIENLKNKRLFQEKKSFRKQAEGITNYMSSEI